MRLRTMLFLMGWLWLGQAYAQSVPMSTGAADSSRRFDYISQNWLQRALATAPNDSSGRARVHKMHGRFEGFWQNRYTTDVPEGKSIFAPVVMGIEYFFSPANSNYCLGGTSSGNWSFLGPKKNWYGQTEDKTGRVVALWVEPGMPNHILAGSASGGLFRTVDGGQHWNNITDGSSDIIPGTMGVSDIAVHPTEYDLIYLSTGITMSVPMPLQEYYKYGMGLVYSTDGGTTWVRDGWFRSKLLATFGSDWEIHGNIPKLAYSPYSYKLYAIYRNRIFVRDGSTGAPTSTSWTDITPTALTSLPNFGQYLITDFEFTESPQGSVVFSTDCVGATNYLLKYNETTQAWQSKAYNIPNFHNLEAAGSTKEVLPMLGVHEVALDPSDKVYLLGRLRRISDNADKYFLYTYNWSTDALNAVDNEIDGYNSPSSPAEAPNKLIVSRHNPNRIYMTDCSGGYKSVLKSETGGAPGSFQEIGTTHADGRTLLLYNSTNSTGGINDVLYCGTDGGVAYRPAGNPMFHSITGEGLNITEFYSVSSSPSNDGILVAGAVDNGIHAWSRNNTAEPWKIPHWGDGLHTAMARNGNLTAFSQWQGNSLETNTTHESQQGINSPLIFNKDNGTYTYSDSKQPREFHQSKWWKPLQFGPDNKVRAGYYFVWDKSLAPTEDWEPAFGDMATPNEPKPSVVITDETKAKRDAKIDFKPLQDYIISDQDPNVGYIAYAKPNWAPNPPDDPGEPDATLFPLYGKLFSSRNLVITPSNPTPTWTNISPPHLRSYQINDIEIDPQHPQRLWVAYGAVQWSNLSTPASQREGRVKYHANYGDPNISSWLDRSAGLPPMPVNKLLYVEGSDDVMFAGTDVGVYRWNKAQNRWECFNNGLPRGLVTNMEINYCSGKLRATIFGRGIWETDYAANMASVTPGDVHTITANTTWNSSKTVSGSIRVKQGATLTISGNDTRIYMPRNGRIVVEHGAGLIVDGATLTNECGYFWGGIQVMGQANQPPIPANQGYLELRNGDTIEYAKEGVWNFSMENGAQGGGIIKASNTTFYNCWRSVGLNHYPNYSYMYNGASQCSFDQTNFIIDTKLLQAPGQMFSSWNTQGGVRIRDCNFRNDAPYNPQQLPNFRGTGIHIGHTGLQVDGTQFQGLYRGIHATGIARTPARTVKVYGNTFIDNPENITMGANSYGDIKSNTIQYMHANKGFGIYFDQSLGSYAGCNNEIYGNYYGGTPPRTGETGIIANMTRGYTTHVINNKFYNLTIGTQTQLTNNKLNYRCNTFSGNAYPWLVNPQSVSYSFTNQGTINTPAGNKFVSNMTGIRSYLNPASWTYYAGSGVNETPSLQGNISLVSTGKSSQCNLPFECYISWGISEKAAAESEYAIQIASGNRYGPEGRLAYGMIIQAYNAQGDMDGLENFLQLENDDESNRLLVSLYIDRQKYTQATSTLTALGLAGAEEDYYKLLIDIAERNREFNSLEPSEYQLLVNLAADEEKEASGYAKAYLETHYNIPWERRFEEMPVDEMSGKVQLPKSPDGLQSKLKDAAPNPASGNVTLSAFVNAIDASHDAFILVRDAAGAEMYRTRKLLKGDNNIMVDVRKWQPGIYLFSLIVGTDALETKKLSVVR